ncbi:MAG: hypothetical protein WB789_00560 [Thermoplasmata archaeon]
MPSGGSFAHRGDRRAIVWCLLVVGVTLVAGLELGLSPASLGQSHLAVSNRISTPAAGQSLSGRSVPPPSAFANGSGTEIPTWVNLSSSVGIPMYVQDPLLTFDPARDGIILAGGTICLRIALGPLGCPQAFLSNATWEFRGGHWSNITDEVGPCPKGISSGYYQGFLVYDPLDGYLVLWDDFGRTNAHGYFFFPQTWILGDSVWTNITGESPPQPGHAGWAVYDPVDSYLVYLDSIGDTWKFAGGVWTRLGNWSALNGGKSVLAPAFQQVPEMAWDPAADQVLLYGGGPNLNQTWTFVGGGWTEANGTGPPPPGNASIPLFYDASLDGVVFYGGSHPTSTAPAPAYTWVYSNLTWTNVSSDVGTAPPRPFSWGGTGAIDPDAGYYLAWVPVVPPVWPYSYLWAFADRPVAVLTSTPSTVEANGTVYFDGQVFGGRGSISFQFSNLPPGCPTPGGMVFSCRPTGVGTFDVGLNVTDAEGLSGNATTFLRVIPSLSESVNLSAEVLDVGQTWNLTVTATRGLYPYSYLYQNLPLGCASDQPTVTCQPTTAGVYDLVVNVTDSLGAEATWLGTVTVHPDPAVTIRVAEVEVEVGETEPVSWNVSGGTGTYTVMVSGLPPGCPAPVVSPIDCQPTLPGTYPVTVNAIDSLGVSGQVTVTITVVPALSLVRFSASPATLTEGASLLLVTNLTGGIGPPSYSFTGLPPGCVSANSSVLGCTPTATGTWTVQVLATDTRGSTVTAELSLTVNASPALSLTYVEWGVLVGGAALVAVGVLLLVRRRRAREEPPTVP